MDFFVGPRPSLRAEQLTAFGASVLAWQSLPAEVRDAYASLDPRDYPLDLIGQERPMTVGNLDQAAFAQGYIAGEDAALDARIEMTGWEAARSPWWRIGWAIGTICTRRRMSAWSVGAWCRTMLRLPVGVNPWLRDTVSGLDFEEGWGIGLVRGGRR